MRGHFSLVSLCAPIHSPSTTTKTITATAKLIGAFFPAKLQVAHLQSFLSHSSELSEKQQQQQHCWTHRSEREHTHTHTFCRKKQAILPASRTTPSTTQLGAVRWVGLHSCKSVRPFYYATIIAAAEALGTATAATKAHKRLALFYCFLCFAVRPQRRARQLALATINLLLSLLSPHQHHHHHQHCYHQQQQQFFFFFPATIANWESVAINFANRYLISSANWARGFYAFEREKKWANQIEVNLGKATSAVLQQNAAFSVWQREQQQAIFFISGRD